jgi:hypothetical protein
MYSIAMSSLRLLDEAPLALRIDDLLPRQNLNGDKAVEASVPGAIHFAHSAGAKYRLNFVLTEFCARVEWHWCA